MKVYYVACDADWKSGLLINDYLAGRYPEEPGGHLYVTATLRIRLTSGRPWCSTALASSESTGTDASSYPAHCPLIFTHCHVASGIPESLARVSRSRTCDSSRCPIFMGAPAESSMVPCVKEADG